MPLVREALLPMSWKYSDPALWEAAINADIFPKGDIAKSYLEWMRHPEYAIEKQNDGLFSIPISK